MRREGKNMASTLLIVESPAKAKTIGKYLGKGFNVKASMGHVRDLPDKKIAVDVEKDFAPSFAILPSKKTVVSEIHGAAKRADNILLAADPDREGEAICYHLGEILKDTGKPIGRVLFHEITAPAIRKAVEEPREIDPHKVSAQIARRIIDRLVGYKVSPLLWDKVKKGLSAGRVQTVALRMICEREAEIGAFQPREYWVLSATLEGEAKRAFQARLTHVAKEKANIENAKQNAALRSSLEGKPWVVASVEKKRQKRSPLPPFTTSKLQQEAARMLKFPVKRTMSIAQKLYEGVDLAKGETAGLITYMRTDSTRLAPEAVEKARDFIAKEFGKELVPPKPRSYAPAKAAQDAHEAIRPTDVTRTPDSVKEYLGREEFALYKLIWKRFVASQMADALFDNTRAQIQCGDALFLAQGSVLVFPGFKAAYEAEAEEEGEGKGALPPLKEGESLTLLDLQSEQKFTEPPPRYTEATLVKALEENGIGRPSTYAAIISTIQERDYVVKEQAWLKPTGLGQVVSELLVKHFPALFDVGYTASMEAELDKVEEGKEPRLALLKRFYKGFEKELEAAKGAMANLRTNGEATNEVCDKCGRPMVLKVGKFGKFLACSGYPECKNTRPLADEASMEVPKGAEVCEKCGHKMVMKQGRFGAFLACENYPACKNTKKIRRDKEGKAVVHQDELLAEKCPECKSPLVKKHGRYGAFVACSNYPKCKYIKKEALEIPCPKCGKPLAKRFSKSRKVFYGCTGYPACDFLSWDKPVKGSCDICGSPYLVEKRRGAEATTACPTKGCKGPTQDKAKSA
jgi:DNA topoisomerase-1